MTVTYIDDARNADWIKRARRQEFTTQLLEFGDLPGHEFRGNQWTGGRGKLVGGETVEDFVAARPQLPGEPDFVWQARIVHDLHPTDQNKVLFATRENYEPVDYIKSGIERWCAERGLTPPPENCSEIPVDLSEGESVARIFENADDQSSDPEVQAAYADFKRQSAEMYEFLTQPESAGGLGIKVDIVNKTDPYSSAEAQAEDLRLNRRISIESGLGGPHEATMTRTEYDQFRAVHDVFGHAGVGGGFDRHGEYQAWLAHSSMYTGAGRAAMSTEYHGVNSALWGGEPDTPGTGESFLLPPRYANPPWDREGLTAAGTPKSAIDALVKALGLDDTFAARFEKLPWHPRASSETQEFGDLTAQPLEFVFDPDQPRSDDGKWTSTGGEPRLAPLEDVRGHALPYEMATMSVLPKDIRDKVMTTVRERIASTQKINSSFDRYMEKAWSDPKIREAGMTWYQNQHDVVMEIAAQNRLDPQSVAAALAAMSPSTTWVTEEPIIRNMALLDKEAIQLSDEKLAIVNGRLDGYDLPHVENGQRYRDLDSWSAVITMQGQFMEEHRGTWGVGLSGWSGFAKGLDLMRGADVDDTLSGAKVRSFTNNIMDPTDPRDVTIDVHMVQGAARDPGAVNDSSVMDTPSYAATHIGAYPYLADVVRRVADDYDVLPNQAQALIWLGYKAEFGNAAPGEGKRRR